MVKPYVADALQSVIYRYGVQDMEVQVWSRDAAANEFEKTFCRDLTTYTRYPNNTLPDLHTTRVKEQREKLFNMSDRELCEAVSAHFNSHPHTKQALDVPGICVRQNLKTYVAETLKTEGEIVLPTFQRDLMVHQFAYMQIQETTIKGGHLECDPHLLDRDTIATKNAATVYKIDTSLQKNEDGSVSVVGKDGFSLCFTSADLHGCHPWRQINGCLRPVTAHQD